MSEQIENSETRLTFAMDNFKNVQELIRFVDQKAGALLVIYGLILTVFVGRASKLKFINVTLINDWYKVLIFSLTLLVGMFTVFILVYQLYYVVMKILKPRLALNYKQNEHSIFYFEHIAEMKKNELIQKYKTINNEDMIEEVVKQIFEVSRILKTKMQRISHAMRMLMLSVAFLLLFIYLSYM